MKRVLKKVLVCILIIFILNNFIIGSFPNNYLVSYASFASEAEDKLNSLFGTVVGLLTWPFRIIGLSIAFAMDKLMSSVAYIETNNNGNPNDGFWHTSLTPYDIVFNTTTNEKSKIKLLDINFFNIDSSNKDSIAFKFRTSIAVWYYALRNISAAILLVVLIYVGIRMTLTNVSPDKKASYKKMLVDWIVSLAIIFLIQYIMLFVIYVNNAIVDVIHNMADSTGMSESLDKLGEYALWTQNIQAFAAAIVYCMLIFQTFGLFISYFNRMLTLAFLTIISPLITLTYSIDKMGDGKAQALNTWLKEYVFTILIQPFHCIIYITFIQVSMNMLTTNRDDSMRAIAAGIITILCINFIREAEKIVRKIFAFGDNGKSGSLATGLVVAGAAAKNAKKIGKGSVKAVNTFKNGFSSSRNAVSSAVIGIEAAKRYMSGNERRDDGTEKSFDEIKSDVRAEKIVEKAKKEEKKKYGVTPTGNAELEAEINRRAGVLENAGMYANEAKAQARLQLAKQVRKNRRKSAMDKNHPNIKKARGFVGKARNVAQKSETLKQLKDLSRNYISGGTALAFGSGYFGATGKAGESILIGSAMYKGVNEAFKSSSKTLRSDATDRLKSLGIQDGSSAAIEVNAVLGDPNKYGNDDEAKKIMDDIKDALEHIGIDKKISTQIQNNINKEISRNPSTNINDIVKNALEKTANDPNNGFSQNDKNNLLDPTGSVSTLANNLTQFNQRRAIYESAKDAGDIGISPDRFVEELLKDFENGIGSVPDNYKTNEQFMDEAIRITENRANRENIFEAPDDQTTAEFIKDKNYADIKSVYNDFDREIERIQRITAESVSTITDSNTRDQIEKRAQAKINQIISAKAKVQDAVLDREVRRLNEEYTRAVAEATLAVTTKEKREVKKVLTDLQKQYDTYISEANSQISEANSTINRNNIIGVKNQNDINIQRRQLENEKRAVDVAKNDLR